MDVFEIKKRWKLFEYNKHSGAIHWLEWSVAEAFLKNESFQIKYIHTSVHDYPDLAENFIEANTVLSIFEKSKKIVAGFSIPIKDVSHSERIYWASFADQFELYLCPLMEKKYAQYAGNQFLKRSIRDLTYQLEEEIGF